MATTPEDRVKRKIKAILAKHGAYYCMPATGGYGSSGHPDFLIGFRGLLIGIEAKAAPGVPTALQWTRLKEISAVGCLALVIDESNVEDLEALFSEVAQSVPSGPISPVSVPNRLLQRTH